MLVWAKYLAVSVLHGIPDESLQEVFRATILAKITYASSAWHGMCHGHACAQLKTMRNWNRSSSDVGDLVTTAAMNRLFLNFSMKLTSVCSIESLRTRNT